jgi:pimeloyl-ACP methyl ester carboxylesterase
MPHPHRARPLFARVAAAAGLALAAGVATAPADVVIFKDGFSVQGNVRKEMESFRDPATGQGFLVPKSLGFDYLDDGARLIVFSSHNRQLGAIDKDVKLRPDYRAYKNPIENRKSNHPVTSFLGAIETPEFDAKWKRTIKVKVPDGEGGVAFDRIEQQVTYLDPYCCFIVSPTHRWSQSFRTSEMDPKTIRKLLATHPELVEEKGKPDALRRVAIARFLKDVGWLYLAKEEVEKFKKDFPAPLAKDAQEQFDKLVKEVGAATAELVVKEADLALKAGRYGYAADLLAAFPQKTAGPKETDRATALMAQLKTAREQYDTGRRLLRALIDEATGTGGTGPFLAAGGGPVVGLWRRKAGDPQLATLADAAESIYADLHPDSAGRLELFVNLAAQNERQKAAGQPTTKKPIELLATAVSGWAKGKSGSTEKYDAALRIWAARNAVLEYQRGGNRNERNAILARFKKDSSIGLDELAQVISLLPPADPEDLRVRTGSPVKPGNGVPEGIYRRTSAPHGQHPAGLDYLIKLPPEYHHGRAYPVLIVLTYPGLDAERLMGAVAAEADKNGYIVVAPNWAPAFGTVKGWGWDGADHDYVTAALRDVIRHFTVDNDRVFLLGGGAGADMAMDVGASHPDLFAGVVAVGPDPRWQGMFINYWKNAQKLPMYVVGGELAGTPNQHVRLLFEKWMPNGFPAMQVLYRGRGVEWYPAETPVMFDWMGRKRRVNGTATLQLNTSKRYPWQTMREEDNHFYWLSADKVHPGNLVANVPGGRDLIPAQLQGDIQGGNRIVITSRGVREIGVWLGRDMIDWTKPVHVSLNRRLPEGWKLAGKKLEPELEVLLEDYWQRGDRRMLFLAKLEFHAPD